MFLGSNQDEGYKDQPKAGGGRVNRKEERWSETTSIDGSSI